MVNTSMFMFHLSACPVLKISEKGPDHRSTILVPFFNMSSMKDWAVEKLSVFLGFDPETLQEQVYPYLMSIGSSNELVEHLTVSDKTSRPPPVSSSRPISNDPALG